jgi:hypothetical protein
VQHRRCTEQLLRCMDELSSAQLALQSTDKANSNGNLSTQQNRHQLRRYFIYPTTLIITSIVFVSVASRHSYLLLDEQITGKIKDEQSKHRHNDRRSIYMLRIRKCGCIFASRRASSCALAINAVITKQHSNRQTAITEWCDWFGFGFITNVG